MDEILENEIKFKEQILKEYMRLSKIAVDSSRDYEHTIDAMLQELQELYKQRRKNAEGNSPDK